jgi:hypothetical protein
MARLDRRGRVNLTAYVWANAFRRKYQHMRIVPIGTLAHFQGPVSYTKC